MKKIFSLCALALLITLSGCKDATTSLTDGNEPLITVGKTEITKDEIYTSLKSQNGVTAIISKLSAFITDKEVPITDEIKKEAQESLDSFVKLVGEDTLKTYIKSMGYETLDEYRDNVLVETIRSEKITETYIKNCYDDINEKYQLRKVQILQTSDSAVASEIQEKIKDGSLTFEDALKEYKSKLTTTTFTGKEQIISNTTSLDSSVFKNIVAVTEDNTLLSTYQYNTKIDTFYVVKVLEVNVKAEDGSDALQSISSVGDEAFAYYLEKYGFTVYDIELYNGIKSQAPTYLVQDNK